MMKFALSILFCFMLTAPAMSQDAKPFSIAVVDVNQLMSASKAAKSIQSQGENLREKYQKQIKSIEADLKKAEQKVVKAGQDEDKEAFMKHRESFQKEMVKSKKTLTDLNQKMDKSIGDALNKLRDEIIRVVGDMAADRGYDLVISRADVVIVSKKIDITAEVMAALNKKLSTVKVKG